MKCVVISVFVHFLTGSLVLKIFQGPLEVVIGVCFGGVAGLLLWYLPSKDLVSLLFPFQILYLSKVKNMVPQISKVNQWVNLYLVLKIQQKPPPAVVYDICFGNVLQFCCSGTSLVRIYKVCCLSLNYLNSLVG